MMHVDLPNFKPADDELLYLILDGNSIDDIGVNLYSLENGVSAVSLYANTALTNLNEISPWVLEFQPDKQPKIVEWVIENQYFDKGFAWLLSSQATLYDVAQHFQQLAVVNSPYLGELIFRLADARIAYPLLKEHIASGQTRLVGPIRTMYFRQEQQWASLTAPKQSDNTSLYTLTDSDVTILENIATKAFATKLEAHINTYFPNSFENTLQPKAETLIVKAKELGFTTERAVYYYANVIGHLGADFQQNPQHKTITQLVNNPSTQTPEQRIEKAAALAKAFTLGVNHV
ncbi:DUF4123 domain-containing protein [Vibrio scophthalmi]|uniref:DUF4123 domain-containing protein n=1 Tax=Vibrio scophthalmi TaxID=45658 RepID=UPI003EBF63E7